MNLNPASPLARLMDAPMRPGAVAWIGLRPERRAAMLTPASARLEVGQGVVADRWRGKGAGARQVTLIAAEDLDAVAAFLGRPVAPQDLRRNLVVRGVNLNALRGSRLRIGEAVVEITGDCHPCSRMEETLGPGGYNAVRGRGGATARVVRGGWVRLGDPVVKLETFGPDEQPVGES